MSDADEVTISSLAQTGEGVATVNGRRVLVPGTMPGDRVRLTIVRDRVDSVVIDAPAPGRLEPPCAIVDACGGCTWQHVPADVQRDARLEQLRRALPQALRDVPVAYVGAEQRYGYRTRARLAWNTRRGLLHFGFRGRSSHEIVDVPSCPVMVRALDEALVPLRDEVSRLGGHGEVGLAVGRDGRAVANVRAEESFGPDGYGLPQRLVDHGFAGAALWAPGATAPNIAGDPRPITRAADGEPLRLGLEGFAQSNEALNVSLATYVTNEARANGRSVLELYAGAGNFTVMLARAASKVTAVESERDAVEAMRANLAARSIANVSAVVSEASALADRRADVVVLDPPRTGAKDVCEVLVKRPPKRAVYVSCDASTLGRDLGILLPSMDVERFTVFEMFPQTPHLETVATLRKR